MDTTHPAFTSRTTERLNKVAADNGWERSQNSLGDIVEYRRGSSYVTFGVSVTGRVTWASTPGYRSPASDKSFWIIELLEGK